MEGFPAVGHGLGLMWEAPWLMPGDTTPHRARHVPRGRDAARPPVARRRDVRAQRPGYRRPASRCSPPLGRAGGSARPHRQPSARGKYARRRARSARRAGRRPAPRRARSIVLRRQMQPIGDCHACIERRQLPARRRRLRRRHGRGLRRRPAGARLTALLVRRLRPAEALLDRWSCLLDREEERLSARGCAASRRSSCIAQGERGFYEVATVSADARVDPALPRHAAAGARRGRRPRARRLPRPTPPQREQVRAAGRGLAGAVAVDVLPPWFHVRTVPGEPLGGIFSP